MPQETTKLRIKEWAEEDRPREKMLLKGASALSNAELIAILIGSGNADETAVELAQRILKHADDNLIRLSRLRWRSFHQHLKGSDQQKRLRL